MTTEEEFEQAVKREKAWIDEERNFARSEIEALNAGEGIGRIADWLDYQDALCRWPDDPDFPNEHKRPFYVTSG